MPYSSFFQNQKNIHLRKAEKIIFGFLAVCLFTGLMLLSTGCSEVVPVDLNSYIEITPQKGYNGFGKVSVSFDTDRLSEDLEQIIHVEKEQDKSEKAKKIATTCGEKFYVANTENLKNGDCVEIKWKNWNSEASAIEAECRIRLHYNIDEVQINGFSETVTVNPFEELKLLFEGYNEYGLLKWEGSGGYGLEYSFSKTDQLSNGQTVTASVLYPDGESSGRYTARTGIVLTPETYEYTVEGLTALTEIDPFTFLKVELTGAEPEGKAIFSLELPGETFPELILDKSAFSDLSNNDTVNLALTVKEEKRMYEPLYGIRFISLTKDYQITGLPKHVTSIADIPKSTMEKIDREMCSWASDNDFAGLGKNAELKSIETAGHFLLISRRSPSENYFGVVMKAVVTDGAEEYECYPFSFVEGMIIDGDGYTAGSEVMRTHFIFENTGKKGPFSVYAAESLDSVRTDFIGKAEKQFFRSSETDF